jgi:multidrug transporter EmrE-like cation transporter
MASDNRQTDTRRGLIMPAIGIALAILLDTVVQFAWKQATVHVPDSAGPIQSLLLVLREPMCHLMIVLGIAQFFNWVLVLAQVDLSFAQPITSLSYVTVAAVGGFVLHENIGVLRSIGIFLIVLGVWTMSRTEARSTP